MSVLTVDTGIAPAFIQSKQLTEDKLNDVFLFYTMDRDRDLHMMHLVIMANLLFYKQSP
jgi:hypothetical protein